MTGGSASPDTLLGRGTKAIQGQCKWSWRLTSPDSNLHYGLGIRRINLFSQSADPTGELETSEGTEGTPRQEYLFAVPSSTVTEVRNKLPMLAAFT